VTFIIWNMKLLNSTNQFWEEIIMMVLLHMAGLENSECIWKIQRKPEVVVSVSMTYKRYRDTNIIKFHKPIWKYIHIRILINISRHEYDFLFVCYITRYYFPHNYDILRSTIFICFVFLFISYICLKFPVFYFYPKILYFSK
jgi:hypothetical protein